MKELFDFLNSVYPLTKDLTDHLTLVIEYKEFKAGECLVRAGHLSEHVYFISNGLLRSFYKEESGQEINVWFMKQGDVVYAERSFLDQIPSTISIQAIKNTGAFQISHEELDEIYKMHTVFNIHGRKLTEKYYKLSLEREEIMRMYRAMDRYNYLLEHYSDIVNLVSDKELATFLRMSPVTLSRLRNKKNEKND